MNTNGFRVKQGYISVNPNVAETVRRAVGVSPLVKDTSIRSRARCQTPRCVNSGDVRSTPCWIRKTRGRPTCGRCPGPCSPFLLQLWGQLQQLRPNKTSRAYFKTGFSCHPEQSEGSIVLETSRFFASLRMTLTAQRGFEMHSNRRRPSSSARAARISSAT